jgi:hypothetical protein
MTEREWLDGADIDPMLRHLIGRAGRRKTCLFACACCRTVWGRLADTRSRQGVETAELFADGLVGTEEMKQAERAAVEALNDIYRRLREPQAETGAGPGDHDSLQLQFQFQAARAAACAASAALEDAAARPWDWQEQERPVFNAYADVIRHWGEARAAAVAAQFAGEWGAMARGQCALLRCLFGNPFRARPDVDLAWLAWGDGVVPRVAEAIYAGRRFEELPVLADALEEAGCANAELLEHLRGPGPHTLGCWPLDVWLIPSAGGSRARTLLTQRAAGRSPCR